VIFNSHRPLPAYLPLDEKIPTDIDDWYSLSKQSDEWTARMAWRRWGIDIVAFRFPFTAPMERIQQMTSHVLDNPDATLREGWSYLDVRDAARAVYLALTMPVSGVHPVLLAAPTTYFAEPTQELLEKWAPDVPRLRSFAGHEVLDRPHRREDPAGLPGRAPRRPRMISPRKAGPPL